MHTAFLVSGTLLKALKAGGGTCHGGNLYAVTERRCFKHLIGGHEQGCSFLRYLKRHHSQSKVQGGVLFEV